MKYHYVDRASGVTHNLKSTDKEDAVFEVCEYIVSEFPKHLTSSGVIESPKYKLLDPITGMDSRFTAGRGIAMKDGCLELSLKKNQLVETGKTLSVVDDIYVTSITGAIGGSNQHILIETDYRCGTRSLITTDPSESKSRIFVLDSLVAKIRNDIYQLLQKRPTVGYLAHRRLRDPDYFAAVVEGEEALANYLAPRIKLQKAAIDRTCNPNQTKFYLMLYGIYYTLPETTNQENTDQ